MKHPFELLKINHLLTNEQIEISHWIQDFTKSKVRPHVQQWYEDKGAPIKELMIEFGNLGLFSLNVEDNTPTSKNAIAYGLAAMEIEAMDSSLRSCLSVQNSLVIYPLLTYGTTEQIAQYAEGLMSGKLIGSFGLTEVDHGSDPASMKTFAKKSGGDWVINGSKMWITNASIADLLIIWAQTEDGICGFLIPSDSPGVSVNEIPGKISMKASKTGAVYLENVVVPESARLPGARGLSGPLRCLNEARFGIVFGVIGAASDSFSAAQEYAISREQFGKSIASYQLTQDKLADMSTKLNLMMLLALHIGQIKQDGEITPEIISYGKYNNVMNALSVCREARTILGAAGITSDYSPLRHANNLESVLTYEGTHEMHLLTIGKGLTGISAFK
jgi:glutaryl-CoA dehydrogenase